MLELNKRLKGAAGRKVVERKTMKTDRQIDALAYELYGLTEEEIAILEGRKE